MKQSRTQDTLEKLIDVNSPIIYIHDYDFIRTDILIDSVKLNDKTKIKEWNPATGITQYASKEKSPKKFFRKIASGGGNAVSLEDFLRKELEFEGSTEERFLVLRNVHGFLNDEKIVTALQLIAQRRLEEENYNTTIFIVSSVLNVPAELNEFISVFEIDLPTEDEIEEIIQEHLDANKCHKCLSEKDRQELMPSLKGLTRFQVDRMIDMAMSVNGTLESTDTELILRQKKTVVKKSGILELVDSPMKINDIGGLEILKEYLRKKENTLKNLEEAKTYGVKVPKGIFLVGMPGCGKSLCAKAAAALFNAPLLQLDMGRLQAKYVGESEANLRKAIKTAEAVAPCVLWIDEIEKGFATGDGKNDVVMRMFATFLSWLQDKQSSVYVIATANNADNLPPELKRKGRFDEIFCVDLPNEKEREEIFRIHIERVKKSKAKCDFTDEDYKKLASMTGKNTGKKVAKQNSDPEYNGADIESVVNEVAEFAFNKDGDDKGKITFADFENVLKITKPISETCREQIEKMREVFDKCKFKSASRK